MATMPLPVARSFGALQVLPGPSSGAYPHGNSVLVPGKGGSILIDPSLCLATVDLLPGLEAILISHAHQDHMAGLGRYPTSPVYVHANDVEDVRSLAPLFARYGLPAEAAAEHSAKIREKFVLTERPDAQELLDGQVLELGGGRTITTIHLPGHTAGHCGFLVEPDGFMFLGDIDLSGFGPYYGDLGSSLEQFEQSLRICRGIEARWYATFHHKGVYEGATAFRTALDSYVAVLAQRDAEILRRIAEPMTLEQVSADRLLYPPHVSEPFTTSIERRTIQRHLMRLVSVGAAVELEPGLFRRA